MVLLFPLCCILLWFSTEPFHPTSHKIHLRTCTGKANDCPSAIEATVESMGNLIEWTCDIGTFDITQNKAMQKEILCRFYILRYQTDAVAVL